MSTIETTEVTRQATEESSLIAKTVTIRVDQFEEISSLAAYNKLKRRQPDNVSGVVREALDLYISQADVSYRSLL